MNQEQLLGLLRMVLTMGGTFLVARGYLKPEDLTSTVAVLVTAIGGVVTAGSLVWSLYSKTKANQIASVAALSNVQQVVTDQKTADKTPSTKVIGPADLAPTK
jgi:hypothetical protein